VTAARRLAAILAADVVGYSRLMGADEAGTAKLVRERREAATPIVRAFGGRLVDRTGDGVLLEFPSVVAAVESAIAIQKMMAERNAALPEAKRILYRVGLNLGDILIEGDEILGNGVNVAARLEGICEPGALCLSEDAYRQAHGRIEAEFVDLGEQELKNIAKPVRVYAVTPQAIAVAKAEVPAIPPAPQGAATPAAARLLPRWPALAAALALAFLAAGAFAWRAGYAPRFMAAAVDDKLAHAPRLSIAVLPFENLSGDKDQDYFADGVTDDLTTDLSHLDGSFVIARGTAMTYKGKPVDAKAIGRELGVRYLLEGSVRRVDENITINAQLISTETGAHVWADRFDGERSKLGELQVEFVSRLANSLGVELVKAEALQAARERPSNPDAAGLAMQGWASLNSGFNKVNYDAAIGYFERALQLDSGLTRAQVGLAWGLVDRMYPFRGGDKAVDLPRAEQLLTKALSAEPNSAWAHYVKADLLAYGKKQINDALSELDVAIENDRNFARAYALRAGVLILSGEAKKAIPEAETALQLSPRDPMRNQWEFRVCHAHAHMAEWETAAEWCQKSVATNAGFWVPYVDLVAANGWLGHDAEAKAAIDGLHKLMPGFTVQDWANIKWSDNAQFQREYARIAEGLRKAGLPEGVAKTN
jgi:TolB-like protein/class 3 adenylate cyclase